MHSITLNEKGKKIDNERMKLKEVLNQPKFFTIEKSGEVNTLKKPDSELIKNVKEVIKEGNEVVALKKCENISKAYEVTGKEKVLAVLKLPANIITNSVIMGVSGAVMWPMIFDSPCPEPPLKQIRDIIQKTPCIIAFPLCAVGGAVTGAILGVVMAIKDTAEVVSGRANP